jgi:hypothetical protein
MVWTVKSGRLQASILCWRRSVRLARWLIRACLASDTGHRSEDGPLRYYAPSHADHLPPGIAEIASTGLSPAPDGLAGLRHVSVRRIGRVPPGGAPSRLGHGGSRRLGRTSVRQPPRRPLLDRAKDQRLSPRRAEGRSWRPSSGCVVVARVAPASPQARALWTCVPPCLTYGGWSEPGWTGPRDQHRFRAIPTRDKPGGMRSCCRRSTSIAHRCASAYDRRSFSMLPRIRNDTLIGVAWPG